MLLAYPGSFGSLQRLALRHTLDRFPSNKELEIVKIFRRVLLGHADTYHIVRENVEEQVHPNDLPRAYATHNISVVKHMGQQVRTKVPQDNLRLFRRCVIRVSL